MVFVKREHADFRCFCRQPSALVGSIIRGQKHSIERLGTPQTSDDTCVSGCKQGIFEASVHVLRGRMKESNRVLSLWGRLSCWHGGAWLFSRVICWTAPYFGSIRPRFQELKPGHSVVTMRKRRAVTNHIRTVHAIAMCNLAEIAAGTMTEATVPNSHRWIPKGMTVQYLQKAETDLTATARIEPIPVFSGSFALPVEVDVVDTRQETVFRAVIDMWISPRKQD